MLVVGCHMCLALYPHQFAYARGAALQFEAPYKNCHLHQMRVIAATKKFSLHVQDELLSFVKLSPDTKTGEDLMAHVPESRYEHLLHTTM